MSAFLGGAFFGGTFLGAAFFGGAFFEGAFLRGTFLGGTIFIIPRSLINFCHTQVTDQFSSHPGH